MPDLTISEYKAKCEAVNNKLQSAWRDVLTLRGICPISHDFTTAIKKGSKAMDAIQKAQMAVIDMQYVREI